MKILFVDTGDPTDPLNWSGTTSNVVKELQREHDVVFSAQLNSFAKLVYAPYALLCRLTKKQAQIFRHYWVARAYAFQVLLAYHRHKPDIVFAMQSIPLAYLPRSVPFVYWTDAIMHDMIDFYWPSSELHISSQRAGIHLDEQALHNCVAALFSSNWAADGARRVVPEAAHKIFTVPFGANSAACDPPTESRALPRPEQGPVRFLFVGGDFVRKGGPATVEAIGLLAAEGLDVHLSIVGSQPFDDDRVPAHVTQYGFLRRNDPDQHHQLLALFQAAHVFIMPSQAECTAIVFAEAASYGLPIVARDVGGTRMMVRDRETGILVAAGADASDLAGACRDLIKDAIGYRQMSLAARQLFESELNWQVAIRRVTEILEGLRERPT